MSHCHRCCDENMGRRGVALLLQVVAVWFAVEWLAPSDWAWQKILAAMIVLMSI